MRYYEIAFYQADYPQIDGNIVHSDLELLSAGFQTIPQSQSYLVNEMATAFGIPMRVTKQDYDYDKLKKDFNLYRLPYIEECTNEYVTFRAGNASFSMSIPESLHYLKTKEHDMLVYKQKQIHKIVQGNESDELYTFLFSIFQKERGEKPLLGNVYGLSEELVDKLHGWGNTLDLRKYFDAECPNIFFQITEVVG